MALWPWWLSGMALAGVAVGHWLLLRRALAVSGRYTALVNRFRFGAEPESDMSQADLLAAMRAHTMEALGDAAVESLPEPEAEPEPASAPVRRTPLTSLHHILFLGGLALGGLLSMLMAGELSPSFALRGEAFAGYFGQAQPLHMAVLIGGGVLVGFGTRMSAGCTSGHGLCGVSQLQKGSFLATGAFFGMAVATSFVLEWLV